MELAAKESETKVEDALRALLETDGGLTAERVRQAIAVDSVPAVTEVQVAAVDLRWFDTLCGEMLQ